MTGSDRNATPSNWHGNPNRPLEKVSWDDAQVFLTRLNEQQAGNLPAGWSYVLPTESQWEYACRAGTTTMYSWGNDINATRANYSVSGLSQTRTVNTRPTRGAFSICMEMCGNGLQTGTRRPIPPATRWWTTGPASTRSRTGWFLGPRDGGPAFGCILLNPSTRSHDIGFRVGFQFTGEHSVDLNARSTGNALGGAGDG